MYKSSIYLVLPIFLPIYYIYMRPIFYRICYHGETKNINPVWVHSQLSNNGHPGDGALVGAGSLWPWTWESGSHQILGQEAPSFYMC